MIGELVEGVGVCVCVCVSQGQEGPTSSHLLSPHPPSQALCSLMMYETASPLEYHRNTTAAQQRCPIMETDGMAPTLFTLSTTKIELARHSRLRRGPWTAPRGALVREDST